MKTVFFRQRWFQLLVGGVILFLLLEQAVIMTQNPNLTPTVILLGAFVVPVAFVAYFYEHVRDRDISLPLLTTCFFIGGIIGLGAAGVLEYATLRSLSLASLFGVALIEESVKLIFPLGMYLAWRYRHEADGLLFGVSAGMGFAALETMGYGMVALIQSQGNVGTLQQVLLFRGLVSPAGHAAWTGLVCAVLWRERERAKRPTLNLKVASAFVLAVLLHAVWDIVSSLETQSFVLLLVFLAGLGAVTAISLTLVVRRYLEARKTLGDPALRPQDCSPTGQPDTK